MSLIKKVLLCLVLIMPFSILAQDNITKVMVGPYEGKTRILIAFMVPSEDGYKMQSIIIDTDKPKNKEDKTYFFKVDLTSTIRSLVTSEKKQKVIIFTRNKKSEIELKCDGKWKKQEALSETLSKIFEEVQTIIQSVPLTEKQQTEITPNQALIDVSNSVLNKLETEESPCLAAK